MSYFPGLVLGDMRSPDRHANGGVGFTPGLSFGSLQLQPMPTKQTATAATSSSSRPPPPQPQPQQQPQTPQPQLQIEPNTQQNATTTLAYPTINLNLNGVPLGDYGQVLSPRVVNSNSSNSNSVPGPNNDSLSRSLSPVRMDSSFRSGGLFNSSLLNSSSNAAVASVALAQAKSVNQLNDMLARSREGLHKLQAELESERTRRIATERDLADVKSQLSNERLTASSNVHHLSSAADKEARLLRELQLAKLVEQQLRTDVTDATANGRSEKEARIRLEERLENVLDELRRVQDLERDRDESLDELRSKLSTSEATIATLQSELQAQRDEVRRRVTQLKSLQESSVEVGRRMAESEKLHSDVDDKHKSEIQSLERQVAELNQSLASAKSSTDSARAECAHLSTLLRDSASDMSSQWERLQKEMHLEVDAHLTSLSTRLGDAQAQQHSLGRLVHDGAIRSATLHERLQAAQKELAQARDDLHRERREKEELAQEHAVNFHALQDRYQSHLHELEVSSNARFHSAQNSGVEDLKHSFELSVDAVKRELERALDCGISGAEVATPGLASPDLIHSPTASKFHSNMQSDHDAQPIINSGLEYFYSSALSLLTSSLLSSLSSAFSTVHKAAERREYDLTTQIALLKQEVEFQQSQANQRRDGEESLAKRLSDLSTTSNNELKKLRHEVHEHELLLTERANVIRELKKRYKREQTAASELKSQLTIVKSEVNSLRSAQAIEIDQLREECQKEIQAAIATAESIANKRLEAENRLRQKAEQESERYVRACQQNEERIFLLQQEKQQMLTLFQSQQAELRAANNLVSAYPNGQNRTIALASAAAIAESEARLARVMAASPTAASRRAFFP